MKALVTPKPVPKYAKPSSMLGFVLCAVVILTVALCIWQFSLDRGTSLKLKGEHLLAAVGLTVAVWVGLLAAWVSLHSSIRQHTIGHHLSQVRGQPRPVQVDKIKEVVGGWFGGRLVQ